MQATEGSRGGRGSEPWHPREGQQTREGTTSWTLKSTTEPEVCGTIIVRFSIMFLLYHMTVTSPGTTTQLTQLAKTRSEGGAHMDSELTLNDKYCRVEN